MRKRYGWMEQLEWHLDSRKVVSGKSGATYRLSLTTHHLQLTTHHYLKLCVGNLLAFGRLFIIKF